MTARTGAAVAHRRGRRRRSTWTLLPGDHRPVRTALEGMRFPAGQHEVLSYAIGRGGVEPAVLDALDELPPRAFTSPEDVVISLPDRA